MKARSLTAAILTAATVLGSAGLAGCNKANRLRIGIKVDQPGLGMRDDDTYSGLDVDVARYVAKDLGYEPDQIDFVEAVSDQRENLLETGQVRLVVASYSITRKRTERVTFAGPYLIAGQDLLVRADETSITGLGTLGGRRLCSVTGSTSAQTVAARVPGVNLATYPTYSSCVDALRSGNVDAVTTDDAVLAGYAAQPANVGKVKLVGAHFSQERYGIGMRKGDLAFCTKVKQSLQRMRDDGSWKRFVTEELGRSGFRPDKANPPAEINCY